LDQQSEGISLTKKPIIRSQDGNKRQPENRYSIS